MPFCFFGAYDPFYPRIAILRRGLELNRNYAGDIHLPLRLKAWVRYPVGLLSVVVRRNCLGRKDVHLLVPAFGHKDIPLAYSVARCYSRHLVFDPLASRYETKIIDWQRRRPGSLAAGWNRLLDRLTLRLADFVLADTACHKNYYSQEFGVNPAKIGVVPVGFDDSLWKPAAPSPEKRKVFTVVFFGSFLPLHGVETMVEAALILKSVTPPVRFVFIGSGQTLPRVRGLLEKKGDANIIWQSWLSSPALVRTVNQIADLCMGLFGQSPKAYRVVPHKIFQAMALGKAVLTLDTPAVREFFRHQQEIYLCPAAAPEAIAEAILELRQNADLRQAIAKRGQGLVWEKYNPAAIGKTFLTRVAEFFSPRG